MIKCPNCGKQNQDHYKFCLGCGSELPRDASKAQAQPTSPTPPSGVPVVGKMGSPVKVEPKGMPMKPPVAEMPPVQPVQPAPKPAPAVVPVVVPVVAPVQAAFQPAAAQPPAPTVEKKIQKCVKCGADVPPDFTFCGRCGSRMSIAPSAPAYAQAAQPTAGEPVPVAPPPPEMIVRGKLVMIQPNGAEGISVPITESGTVVGREVGEEFKEDFFLSPKHARFFIEGSSLIVEDLGSLNGIYYRLLPDVPYEIISGDLLRMGQEVIRFDVMPEATTQETPIFGSLRRDTWARISLVLGNKKIGNAFPVEGKECLVGRERGNIIFPEDGYVSGLHLRVWKEGGKYFVTDLKSSNGTYLRINHRKEIKGGEYLLVGQFLYRVDF